MRFVPQDPTLPDLSIVVPMFDEAAVVDRLVDNVSAEAAALGRSFELICVDDGSRDGTAERLAVLAQRNPHLVLVVLSRNFGKEAALVAGLEAARGKAAILMDADLQHPPDLLPSSWPAGTKASMSSTPSRPTAAVRAWSTGSPYLPRRVSWVRPCRPICAGPVTTSCSIARSSTCCWPARSETVSFADWSRGWASASPRCPSRSPSGPAATPAGAPPGCSAMPPGACCPSPVCLCTPSPG